MLIALAISVVVVGLAATPASSAPDPLPPKVQEHASGAGTHCRHARSAVPFYRQVTWTVQSRWRTDLADRTPLVRGRSCAWARYAADEWAGRARNALRSHTRYLQSLRSERHQLYEKWRCIHEHEGAWNANTGNGYYGGLQMDWSFMRSHGAEFLARWGTADRWPVWAQIEAAEDAYRTRGFSPWPNTSRMCGLR